MLPENKKIGIDIDETIAATYGPLLEYINQESGRNIQFDDLIHHEWGLISHIEPPLSRQEATSHIQAFDLKFRDHENILPIKGSQDILKGFHKSGYDLIAITARNEESAKSLTFTWLDRHFPDIFTSVHFTSYINKSLGRDKSTVCKELGVEIMIEDNLDFSLELAHNGIASLLLEKPWNKQRTEEHPLITRVRDWKEIEQKFL